MLRDRMKSLFLHFSIKLKTVALLMGSSLIIFSFQNCGQAPSDSEGENSSTLDAKMTNVPFAYDVVLNQITVNGCDPSVAGVKDDFMIRAGAYDDPAKYVGLGLRKEFTDYVLNNYGKREDPANPKSRLTVPQEMTQSILQTSPKNAEASLVIGLTDAYSTEMESGGNKGNNAPLGVLSHVGIAEPLSKLQVGYMSSYFPEAPGKMPRIERSIPMSTAAWKGVASIASQFSNNQVVLSAYFKDGDTVIGPVDSKGNTRPGVWYGRNYSLNFVSSTVSNYLSGVNESVPSSVSSIAPTWACARYPVVDPEDVVSGVCQPAPVTDTALLPGIRMLRRHLPAHLWDIRPTSNGICLVPVKGVNRCYGDVEITPPTVSNEVVSGSQCLVDGVVVACASAGQRLRLDYDGAAVSMTDKKQCVLADGKTIVRCMRYVSVCTRAAN